MIEYEKIGYLNKGILTSILSLAYIIFILVLRYELNVDYQAISLIFGHLLFIIFYFLLIPTKILNKSNFKGGFLTFVTCLVFLFPILGSDVKKIYYLISLLGYVSFFIAIYIYIKNSILHLSKIRILNFSIFYFLISFAIVIQTINQDQLRFIFFPELGALGIGDGYNYFYNSIVAIVKATGRPSLGADSLENVRYHVGSMMYIGQYSELLNIDSNLSFIYIHFFLFIPLLIGSLVGSAQALSGKNNNEIIIIFTVCLLFIIVNQLSYFFENNLTVMTSSTMSIILMLFSLPYIMEYSKGNGKYPFLYIIFNLILIIIISIIKISTGLMFGLMSCIYFYKNKNIKLNNVIIIFILWIVSIYIIGKNLSPDSFMLTGKMLFLSYLQLYNINFLIPLILPLFIILAAKYSSLIFCKNRIIICNKHNSVPILMKQIFYYRNIKDEDILLVLYVFAFICSVLLMIGSNSIYFFTITTIFSILLLNKFICYKISGTKKTINNILIIIVITFLPIFLIGESYSIYKDIQYLNNKISYINGDIASTIPSKNISAIISKNKFYEIFKELRKEYSNEKIVLYIPKSNKAYWTNLSIDNPYKCLTLHTLPQATVGMPVYFGYSQNIIAKYFYNLKLWYEYECKFQDFLSIQKNDSICKGIKDMGYNKYISLPDDNLSSVTINSCN